MKENEILEEEIDRYLEGSMSNEENEAFNLRMAKDSELLKEVELQRSIIKAIRKEQLEKIIQKEEVRIAKKGSIRKLVFYIGPLAVAASLVGFFYVGYLNNCENLANQYYSSYSYTPIPSRGEENLQLTKSDSIFFNALLQLENGHNKLAIVQLENLRNSSSEMLAASDQAVKWYLSLAYLKNGEKKKARILLLEITSETNNEYKLKANDLLKEL